MFFALIFTARAQEFKTIRDGIEHAQFTRPIKFSENETKSATVNVLRLDLKKVRLDVVHAMDSAIGLEKTSSIARRHAAFAAVNAGFFRIDSSIFRGDAAGVLQIDGKLLSESFGNRIALGILNGKDRTEIEFAHLKVSQLIGFGVDSQLVFSGINRERKNDEIILYTADFHRTTLTNRDGTEIILSDCSSSHCRAVKVVESKGSSTIPPDGYVISIGKDALAKSNDILSFAKKQQANLKRFQILGLAKEINVLEPSKQMFFKKAEDVVGGVPQIINNGKIEITWEREVTNKSLVETRHPRTAVARLKDGRALLIAVDGRSETSAGMNLPELAEMLLEMGAVEAMNLDGGGSTTMFLDGKVVNRPSDKEGERPVSDAILVSPRK